jgi:hypothetical protein
MGAINAAMSYALRHNTSRRALKSAIAALLLCSGRAPAANVPASAVERADLRAPLSTLLCGKDSLPTLNELWQANIFDADLQVQLIRRDDQLAVKAEDLAKLARELSVKQEAFGYAWGDCPDRKTGWIASASSPVPLTRTGSQLSLADDASLLKSFCRDLLADHADRLKGQTTALPRVGQGWNLESLGPGTVSITCMSLNPAWRGPLLLALLPVEGGPSETLASAQALDKSSSPEQKLVDWVNALRAEDKLPSLKHATSGPLQASVLKISLHPTIRHDLRQIDSATRELKKHYTLLGEDRVSGGQFRDMAWLLWNSPRHRNLLLNPRADTVAINVKRRGDKLYAVLLVAQSRGK